MKAALDYVSDVATQTTILAKRMTEIQYRIVKGPYQQTIRAMCSFIEVLIYMNKTLSGRIRGLKTKMKSIWVIPKVVAVAYESFKSQFNWAFT